MSVRVKNGRVASYGELFGTQEFIDKEHVTEHVGGKHERHAIVGNLEGFLSAATSSVLHKVRVSKIQQTEI